MVPRLVVAIMAGSLLLAGCQSRPGGGPAMRGPGGSAGAAAEPGPAPIGLVLGPLADGEAGKALDDADRAYMDQQTSRALETLPTNQNSTWTNPDGKSQAEVTPTRTYQRQDGTYCRQYTQALTVGANQQKANGTACRLPDGSWRAASG